MPDVTIDRDTILRLFTALGAPPHVLTFALTMGVDCAPEVNITYHPVDAGGHIMLNPEIADALLVLSENYALIPRAELERIRAELAASR